MQPLEIMEGTLTPTSAEQQRLQPTMFVNRKRESVTAQGNVASSTGSELKSSAYINYIRSRQTDNKPNFKELLEREKRSKRPEHFSSMPNSNLNSPK